MSNFNRRDFLKISAATAAIASAPKIAEALTKESPTGDVAVWTTTGNARHEKQKSLRWKKASASGTGVVKVDSEKKMQEVLGFGAAFTDAACFTLNRLDASARKELLNELFDPSQMGLSVSRICIGSSDYATKAYNYSEGTEPDTDLSGFSIDHDRAYILPILREVRAVNPDMWLLGSPWSPPAWMKFNKSMLGGSMRRKYLPEYARYFDKFLAAYAAEGVRVNSVTPQNEVDTDQDGRMPACTWPQEYEIEFVRDHLGPLLSKSANPADIWVLDHNYNLWGRAVGELEDREAAKFIKGIAWHGYVGKPESMTKVKQMFPGVDMFWTEGGPDFEKPGYETEWAKWGKEFTEILRNWARCIIAWNYALDENGNPNIGPFKCAGLVTVDSKTRAITRGGQYWAMRHFSHIRRGARVVQSSGTADGVSHLVAKNKDGGYVAVLTNMATKQRTVKLAHGESVVEVALAPDSVTTLTWG